MKLIFFLLKFEIFYENYPPTRHIKYKRKDFAPCNKSNMAKKLLSTNLERFLRIASVNCPKLAKWQSLNPHNFTKNDHDKFKLKTIITFE